MDSGGSYSLLPPGIIRRFHCYNSLTSFSSCVRREHACMLLPHPGKRAAFIQNPSSSSCVRREHACMLLPHPGKRAAFIQNPSSSSCVRREHACMLLPHPGKRAAFIRAPSFSSNPNIKDLSERARLCAPILIDTLTSYMIKPLGQLVLVSSTPLSAYTPSLSTL